NMLANSWERPWRRRSTARSQAGASTHVRRSSRRDDCVKPLRPIVLCFPHEHVSPRCRAPFAERDCLRVRLFLSELIRGARATVGHRSKSGKKSEAGGPKKAARFFSIDEGAKHDHSDGARSR